MIVGSVKHNPKRNAWEITCQPHVTIKLKRVFGKIDTGSFGTHRLSNTLENARDLVWFIARYPMEMSPQDAKFLHNRAAAHVEQESFVERLLHGECSAEQFKLAISAREYQRVAATLALKMGRLLVADEVGVGKTLTGICCLTNPAQRPALVVTMTHLPRQWQEEIERFCPGMRVHILKRTIPYDLTVERRQQVPFPDVIVTSYSKLTGWAETLAQKVRSVVFDEVQELRRFESDKYGAAKHIADKCKLKVGLSATPIYNYGEEFFNVLNVLAPSVMGTREEFSREWCTKEKIIREPEAFGVWLRQQGLMLARTRKDVGRELPEHTKVIHAVDADLSALDQVSASCAELARLILSSGQKQRGQQFQASEEFTNKLRQATGIAKAPFVAEFVRLLLASEKKVVLFGWHREVYSIWLDRLKEFNPVMYTGSESPAQKLKSKEAFVNGDARVLIISLRSGAAGMNGLQTVCRTVVHGELDWSPGVMEQADGRVYRDGQPDPVVSYYLVADSGADPIMSQVLGLKRGQLEPVVKPGQPRVEQLGRDGDHVRRLAEHYLRQVKIK